MVKVAMLLLFTLLFVLEHCWYATSLVINPAGYSGGKASGDPAPGRSPGPPPPQSVNVEQQQIKTVTMKNIKCNNSNSNNSNNKVLLDSSAEIVEKTQQESLLNVTVFHRLFKADLIVTGIEYQVIIERQSQGPVIIAYTLKSTINDIPNGKFIDNDNNNNNSSSSSTKSNHCNPSNIYTNQFLAFNDDRDTITSHLRHHVNWTTSPENLDFQARLHNLTFELNYQVDGDSSLYTVIYPMSLTQDCQLRLSEKKATITSRDLPPHISDCQVWFPSSRGSSTGHGLVIELTRLNVPCSRGYIHFSNINTTTQPSQLVQQQQQQHFRSHRQAHICGKLEELPENDRRIYFPFSHTSQPVMHIRGGPIFSLTFRLVDYCYNVTFVGKNDSFELQPTAGELQCTFKIYLPYGNRVALTLQIGGGSSSSTSAVGTHVPFTDEDSEEQQQPSATSSSSSSNCDGGGLETQLVDGDNTWSHCTQPGDAQRQIEVVSRENKVVLRVNVRRSSSSSGNSASSGLGLRMTYRAEPIDAIVGVCGFGWVAVKQFCVAAVEEARLPWSQAEMECGRRGGHLASIRNEHAQSIVNSLLLNSPGYRDHNAYWIGASDRIVEGDFRWSDGLPFSFTNWFPGWSQHGHYNRQPNDDGLSEQDCVEARRIYSLPTSTASLATAFMWNDRDCSTPNYFICERLQNDEPLEDGWPPDCNRSVELSRQQPRAVVSSPGFPRQYPDNADCDTDITAPPGYRLVLDFEELVLENETLCSYDYLEIHENTNNNATSSSSSAQSGNSSMGNSRRLCGDWSSKLKLLRYVSNGSKLKLRFSSDYSHHFGGYKARVSMESAMQCSDDRLYLFNNSCYLFVSYPEVTWSTAQQICRGKKGELSSILSSNEERFITTNIRKSLEYRTSALYWLGAKTTPQSSDFTWTDGSPMNYKGWLPGQQPTSSQPNSCLSVQWTPSPTPMLPSGLYWKSRECNTTNTIGGYVCKRPSQLSAVGINFNKTVTGSEGVLTTPHFPETYYDNLDFSVKISAPTRTRIVAKFTRIDIEPQIECLYDFVELASGASSGDSVKFCGSYTNRNFTFVSQSNSALLTFHSDYSIAASGFSLSWKAVDVAACPQQTLTAKEGHITSPNFPDFLLAHLDCTFTILAPLGKRVWIEFLEFDVSPFDETLLLADLGQGAEPLRPFSFQNLLTDGVYISNEEQMRVKLKTRSRPFGKGFRASYKIISSENPAERVINLKHNSSGTLLHLNYPDNPPVNVNFVQHFIAPPGYIISLQFFHVKLVSQITPVDGSIIEVFDNYYDSNGSVWKLCYDIEAEDAIVPTTPISITSFLNTLHVRQRNAGGGILLNASLRVLVDEEFKAKLLKNKDDGEVEGCVPNPCQNGGKCVTKGAQNFCQCVGHFTGLFCALTKCELEPCVFGTCQLTNSSYKCRCKSGYIGPTCEQKKKPCEGNPCESRGVCVERGDSFFCRCHAWWEGTKCEKRMLHIPYKPLSERMFHEPFWLGLMTVFVVMAVIGLVWCAKRHFPEKIEKLLAEENERNRGTMSSLRSSSVREQLAVASAQTSVTVTPSPGPAAPRSLFGRLGSPSPKKKRNNSTPTKKNAAEKKQILQQLISPAPGTKHQLSRKVSLGELMQMTEIKPLDFSKDRIDSAATSSNSNVKETKFSDIIITGGGCGDSLQTALSDPKLEKKVTFARLLNKVSAEMSSGSEMELGIMQTNRLGCVFARPSSTPPSPNVDARSPNSTSSNQGSDSFTSSDLAIPSALSSSISDLMHSRNARNQLPNGRQKPASADSILAMFRNFSASSAGVNLPQSLHVSPSTTPTASSPQDDIAGDDESSTTTSSAHTPVSFSSGYGQPDSPVLRHQQIEVPVLDPLSAHKSSNFLHPPTILLEIPSTINKCLSPIREMPTPLPSPAITPIMRRSAASSVDEPDMSDDRISIEIPNISISDDDDIQHCVQDIVIDPHAEDGLILEEAAAMQTSTAFRIKNRPPPLGETSEPNARRSPQQPLVIPMLTIQTPSPTHTPRTIPSILFPGSPPPHKESCSFHFPPTKQTRKMFKDFDKPTSLDLPCAPPMITITCNLSEAESDAESISPAAKTSSHHLGVTSAGMSYLSPFSRGDHNASESNLSSSGYSSMASPGPSRCGSSNPLCPSEMEDQGPPGSGHSQTHRRPSPVLKSSGNASGGNSSSVEKNGSEEQRRGRSDSETLSDDPLLESNDEGIGTDHIDEKIEEGDVKSAKELEVFMVNTNETVPLTPTNKLLEVLPQASIKKSLQLPSIIVQCDTSLSSPTATCDKLLPSSSPMSSRSESPLSDRRFSPHFYGRNKDFLPFTDSDGLYDFPSSDKVNVLSTTYSQPQQHKKTGRKQRSDRKSLSFMRNCKTPSPTKPSAATCMSPTMTFHHLDVPSGKDVYFKVPPPRKLSPKRRVNRMVSSSSSSDSINSGELRVSSSSPSPDTIRWSSPIDWIDDQKLKKSHSSEAQQTDDACDDASAAMLPKSADSSKQQKISRLRAISHQIRFLRRLEQSLKRRERTISPCDSLESGGDDDGGGGDDGDSPRATSPLLATSSGAKVEIMRKSSSIGKLQANSSSNSISNKSKKGKYKRSAGGGGELLLPPQQRDDRPWSKRIVITGNGHSD